VGTVVKGVPMGHPGRADVDPIDDARTDDPTQLAMDVLHSPSHELGLLRIELMQFERHGYDLMRYKLFAAAVLGGVAVGVGPAVGNAVSWVLALVPLVCIFVDAAHIQSDAAILTIARFLRRFPDHVLGQYERYIVEMRHGAKNPIVLHYLALSVTTVTLSLAVAARGTWMMTDASFPLVQAVSITTSGVIGIVGGVYLHRLRKRYLRSIDEL